MLPEGKKIGGAPANFAYHVSQYGFDGYVVSAVGDDKLGNEILESFNNRRLNYLIQRVPYPTGTVQIELDEAGIPCYEIKENVAWDNVPFTVDLEKLAKKTRAVCFGSLAQRNTVSRETINRFLDVMSDAAGQYRVFDVNLRQGFYDKEILCNSMKRCNILKINDEELIAVSRMFEYPGKLISSTVEQTSYMKLSDGFYRYLLTVPFTANDTGKCITPIMIIKW